MKKFVKVLSGFLAAAMTACAVPAVTQASERKTPELVAEALNGCSPEAVTEALNGYSLGYMSWGVRKMGLHTLQEKLERSGKPLPEVRVAVLDTGLKKTNRHNPKQQLQNQKRRNLQRKKQ